MEAASRIPVLYYTIHYILPGKICEDLQKLASGGYAKQMEKILEDPGWRTNLIQEETLSEKPVMCGLYNTLKCNEIHT